MINMNNKFLLGTVFVLVLLFGIQILIPHLYNKKITNTSIHTEDTESIMISARGETIKEYTEAIKEGFKKTDNPKIVFGPSITSDEEKMEIKKKLLDPYVDFNQSAESKENSTYLFIINKNTQKEFDENKNSYLYQISTIRTNGDSGGWVDGKIGSPLEYWSPTCMGDCKFSVEFSKKYPDIVNKYKELNNLK